MNGKERVQAAVAREPVDYVPLGLYTVDYDTVERVIGRPTYVRNKIAIKLALWEGRRDEVAQSIKEDTVAFYRKIDCADLILPKEAPFLPPRDYCPDPPQCALRCCSTPLSPPPVIHFRPHCRPVASPSCPIPAHR